MSMRAPAIGLKINFNIAGAGGFRTELQNRTAKIRPGLAIMKTGMKNAHGLTVQSLQLVAQQALMQPDNLQQPFRRCGLAFVAQRGNGCGLCA